MVELLGDVLAKGVACATGRDAPAATLIRVRPEEVTHRPFMRHLLNAVQLTDVVQGVERWGDASMHADDLVLHHGRHGQVVKGVREELPNGRPAVGTHTFVKEAVDLCDLATLVVAAEESDALLIADLVKEHEGHRLHRVVAAVNIVAEEEVVCLWHGAADAEELLQVQELAMDVAANRHRATHRLAIRLLLQDLPHPLAQRLALRFVELTLVLDLLNLRLKICVQCVFISGPHPECGRLEW
mmetsp:Transcript_74211/g.172137  ORF Transcript_74211/g.172137 Transcript_74211/m.172137 type:complete len:242 (-) Transcript_74211:52-777(-)